jgi:hypothetical protein
MDYPDKLILHGEAGTYLESHPYLFRCRLGGDCFLEIQKEMAMLNDFCVVIRDATEQHSHTQHIREHEDGADAWDDQFAREMMGYSAREVGKLFSPASSMVLLYLFLIKSLRALNISYNPENFGHWRSNSKSPEIAQLIERLEKNFGISFGVLDDEKMKKILFQTVRKIRNNFTHGEWGEVEKDLQTVSQVMAFGLVSELLSRIEIKFIEHGVESASERDMEILS